jgi:transglutaminase-like putative cysteine protease/predicted glutamine amidotransferase
MSQLLAISADRPISPLLKFNSTESNPRDFVWGLGWYPSDGNASDVIKDSELDDAEALTNVIEMTSSFYSSTYMGYFYGSREKKLAQDLQPFSRPYAGKDWVLVHNGQLSDGYKKKLPLLKSAFEPVGSTDAEHIICWLLNKFQSHKARNLSDLDYSVIHGWLKQLNDLGAANIILSTKNAMLIYQDKDDFNPVYYTRFFPPNNIVQFTFEATNIELGLEEDSLKSYMIFSSKPISPDEGWKKLVPGQMVVVSHSSIVWDSHEGEQAAATVQLKQHQIIKKPKQPDIPYVFSGLNNVENQRKLSVIHETNYTYDSPIRLSKHLYRLQPVFDHEQLLLDYKLDISCGEHYQTFVDVFGNKARYVEITKPYTQLSVKMSATVSIPNKFNYVASMNPRHSMIPLPWMPWQKQMLAPYLTPAELPESQLSELMDYAMSFVERNDNDANAVIDDINQTIFTEYQYLSGSTNLSTTAFDVYCNRHGVCQDFSNLFICLARLLGIPARYRSGYIFTGNKYDNPQQGDATHAWVEVYLPWIGWRGYDPTNGIRASSDHIRVACGRNYHDATPTSGTIYQGGGKESLWINVQVRDITNV